MAKPTLVQRFWSKVLYIPNRAACWLWKSRTRDGYGIFWVGGSYERACDVAWAIVHGPIPDGAEVKHLCRNPLCCNIYHLYLCHGADTIKLTWDDLIDRVKCPPLEVMEWRREGRIPEYPARAIMEAVFNINPGQPVASEPYGEC